MAPIKTYRGGIKKKKRPWTVINKVHKVLTEIQNENMNVFDALYVKNLKKNRPILGKKLKDKENVNNFKKEKERTGKKPNKIIEEYTEPLRNPSLDSTFDRIVSATRYQNPIPVIGSPKSSEFSSSSSDKPTSSSSDLSSHFLSPICTRSGKRLAPVNYSNEENVYLTSTPKALNECEEKYISSKKISGDIVNDSDVKQVNENDQSDSVFNGYSPILHNKSSNTLKSETSLDINNPFPNVKSNKHSNIRNSSKISLPVEFPEHSNDLLSQFRNSKGKIAYKDPCNNETEVLKLLKNCNISIGGFLKNQKSAKELQTLHSELHSDWNISNSSSNEPALLPYISNRSSLMPMKQKKITTKNIQVQGSKEVCSDFIASIDNSEQNFSKDMLYNTSHSSNCCVSGIQKKFKNYATCLEDGSFENAKLQIDFTKISEKYSKPDDSIKNSEPDAKNHPNTAELKNNQSIILFDSWNSESGTDLTRNYNRSCELSKHNEMCNETSLSCIQIQHIKTCSQVNIQNESCKSVENIASKCANIDITVVKNNSSSNMLETPNYLNVFLKSVSVCNEETNNISQISVVNDELNFVPELSELPFKQMETRSQSRSMKHSNQKSKNEENVLCKVTSQISCEPELECANSTRPSKEEIRRRSLMRISSNLNTSSDVDSRSQKLLMRRSLRRSFHQVMPNERKSSLKSPSFQDVYRSSADSKKCNISCTLYEENEDLNSTTKDEDPAVENSFHQLDVNYNFTPRDAVLQRCGQLAPVKFSDAYTSSYWSNCEKIGEGVYGEVFMSKDDDKSVLKIIPIEGDSLVNGEPQKKFGEILSEIVIAMELSELHAGETNSTDSFSKVKTCLCVEGKYPEELLELWDIYNESKGSENDSPEMFTENQLYIILELANGGSPLEQYVFSSAKQSHSVLMQTAFALAVAEKVLQFEHRDLHWGNVLIFQTKKKNVTFKLMGKFYRIPSHGVKVTIIDFTLSRMTYDNCDIFNDLSRDETLFTAEGDYQFQVYRLMKECTMNKWHQFEPYTNILWLHYLIDKMRTMVNYQNKISKVHKEGLKKLMQLQGDILNYESSLELVLNTKI